MISRETHGKVALLIIERHERRNALDLEHLSQLRSLLVASLDEGARAVVITGHGTAFSAGADLAGVYGNEFRDELYSTLSAVVGASTPVIAAINGPAIGAGAQLAIACDLRVAAPDASLSIPTARNGLAVDPWTIRRLALLSNGSVARSMLLGCRSFATPEAVRTGLADTAGGLDDAMAWAADIATMAPLSLHYSKKTLELLLEPRSNEAALEEAFEACWGSDDVLEGRRARTERRQPEFTGR